jgi:hypothetical protein
MLNMMMFRLTNKSTRIKGTKYQSLRMSGIRTLRQPINVQAATITSRSSFQAAAASEAAARVPKAVLTRTRRKRIVQRAFLERGLCGVPRSYAIIGMCVLMLGVLGLYEVNVAVKQ